MPLTRTAGIQSFPRTSDEGRTLASRAKAVVAIRDVLARCEWSAAATWAPLATALEGVPPSLASLDEFKTSFAKLAKNLLDNNAPTSYGSALSTTTDAKLLTDFGVAALLDTTQPDGWTPNLGCRTGFSDSADAARYYYAQTYAKAQLAAGTVPEFACDYVSAWAQLPLVGPGRTKGRPPLLAARLPLSRNSMRVGASVSEDVAAKARVLDKIYHDGVRELQSQALPYTLAAAERTAVSESSTYRASISRRDARRTGSSRRAAGPRFLKRPCAASSRLL